MPKLLIKVRGDGSKITALTGKSFSAAQVMTTPILKVSAPTGQLGPGTTPQTASTWVRVDGISTTGSGWDAAHELLDGQSPSGLSAIEAIEPEIDQYWPVPGEPPGTQPGFAAAGASTAPDETGGQAVGHPPTWYLDNDYSQLRAARNRVGEKQRKVRIAHLDTGYDPHHATLPQNLRPDLGANFADGGGAGDSAIDPPPPMLALLNNYGHGTGTLSLLAGNKLDGSVPTIPGFADYLGGAPLAEILPIRIADSVIRFTTGTIVEGIAHALANKAQVLSMSMGGVGSNALVDAVNEAYDAGLVMVTAAGNNYANRPSPKTTVFPARFLRVIAACGVMANGRAYAELGDGTMQGNFGPAEKMTAALGAYTPNVPWAMIGKGNLVRLNGAGTSAATPQIAAAAALWIAEHWNAVMAYPEPWMRVEAVRLALFEMARHRTERMGPEETRQKIGEGALRAYDALDRKPAEVSQLRKLAPAQPSWSWLNLLSGEGGVSLSPSGPKQAPRMAMLQLELTQMAHCVPAVDATNAALDDASPVARNRYLEAVLDGGQPSKPLRGYLESLLARAPAPPPGAHGGGGGGSPPGAGIVVKPRPRDGRLASRLRPADPPRRRLRIFALDPSLAKALETTPINETTLSLPWDDLAGPGDDGTRLKPGPVGEYIEVVDIDPASQKIYDAVDLNDKFLLAQSGLQPSEGNPKFHQQMVYAVAMATIENFERAIGRRAQWARHTIRYDEKDKDKDKVKTKTIVEYVPRLRIYPHALRNANAYYSPDKKALLFGYFKADSRETDVTAPGTVVFTCLSSDVIAHETAHALLDGLHRGYQEASNPDVPAFHEGFADIVALFQHFAIPELVSFSIGKSRADLAAADLLAGLARQFGEGTNVGGALRNYVDPSTDRLRYSDPLEVHHRGAILVRAIYDAFIAIVTIRTADLLRIATNGSGVLPDGALHPDLVHRLTVETCKTAKHFLGICIRALDYCPCVDITFGDYLRAIITSDADAMPEDPHGYRIAIMQAFRQRGIIPHDVRTMSAEALTWNVAAAGYDQPDWLTDFLATTDFGLDRRMSRHKIFQLEEINRWKLWRALRTHFADAPSDEERGSRLADFGLLLDIPRFDESGKVLAKAREGETTFEVRSVRTARRRVSGTYRTFIIAVIQQRQWVPFEEARLQNGGFWFRGGATLIIQQAHDRSPVPVALSESDEDEENVRPLSTRGPRGFTGHIQYVITKHTSSTRRLDLARRTIAMTAGTPRSLYFESANYEPFAMMHDETRGGDHG